MTFAWPYLLWLIPLPLLLMLVGLLRSRPRAEAGKRDHILRGEAGAGKLQLSAEQSSPLRRKNRPLLCLALAASLLALARPQWGVIDEPVFTSSREILIGLDLSRSMLATDVKPARLDRARLLVQSLLDRLRGERIGLVIFSGTAFLQCPLSSDYEILRDLLPSLGPDYLPEGGTAYKALLSTSLEAFSTTPNTDRFLIVLSDGEALDDDWKQLLPSFKEKQVRVLSLGVGTAEGAMIPDGEGALVKDERGAVVLSRLEPLTLQSLASETGGAYRNASTWVDLAALLRETVEKGKTSENLEKVQVRHVERFQWPLATALILGLLSLAHEFPGRIRPRQLRIQVSTTKIAALLLGFSLLTPSGSPELQAASTQLETETESPHEAQNSPSPAPPSAQKPTTEKHEPALVSTVRQLSTQDELSTADCLRIIKDTLAWAGPLHEAHKPFSPGPVHDALEACVLGEKLGPQDADWKSLAERLKELLTPKKEEKQEDKQKDKPEQNDKNQDKNQEQEQQNAQDSKDQKNEQNQEKNKDQSSGEQDKPETDSEKQNQSENEQKDQEPKKQGEKQNAFDKNKTQDETQPEQQPPQPREEMKQAGGAPVDTAPTNTDPSLVVPLEKLQKLKSKDDPGRFFELMRDEKQQQPANKKNW